MSLVPCRRRAADELHTFVGSVDWSHLTARRQQILEAFVSLASTSGYESVTMRILGARVGVKAPSIYRHFPHGREEIVTEAFRWHFYRFASAVLDGIREADGPERFWNSLVSVHLRRQMESTENDMWDILMASDRLGGFLPSSARVEYAQWCGLYENLFAAAAVDLGYAPEGQRSPVKAVVKMLDTANEWCTWDGSQEDLDRCVERAISMTHALMNCRFDAGVHAV